MTEVTAEFAELIGDALNAAQPEPLHPNHRSDLRYILGVLERLSQAAPEDGDLAAAITGMRYVLKRTEEAAQPVPDAVWEALQRMIEDGFRGGEASRDDARVVARHRDRYTFMRPAPRVDAEADRMLAAQPSGQAEVDSLGLELAAAQASEGHLSRLVDHLQVIAHDALAEMKRLHASLEPDDTLPGVPAYVSGESVEIFEDERVRLVRAFRNGPTGGGAYPGTGTSVATPGDNAPAGGEQAQQDAVDAARYRWLTEDHDDSAVREHRNGILRRMPVTSYSAASRDIDIARQGDGGA